jgi:hypothetical protein
MSRSVWGLVAALALLGVAAPVQAQSGNVLGLSEIRGGVMAHSVDEPGPSATFGFFNLDRIEDANVELVFKAPDWDAWSWIGSPRFELGTTVNFGGLENMLYGGLLWHANLFGSPVFVEGGLGGALTDGQLHNAVYPHRSLGCSTLFHEQASLGYDITDNADVMLTVEHASHANLCGADNRGLTNLGIRVGFKF